MGIINPTIPTIGDPNSSEDSDIRQAIIDIVTAINGNLDSTNVNISSIASALSALGGISITGDYSEVLTEQTTTSTTWTDLATVGPSVTVNATTNGLLLVGTSVGILNTTGGISAYVGVNVTTDRVISGTTPASLTDERYGEIILERHDNVYSALDVTGFKVIPITAGSRTVSLKYARPTGGTATYKNRKLWVLSVAGF
jgi:hypothetical protein